MKSHFGFLDGASGLRTGDEKQQIDRGRAAAKAETLDGLPSNSKEAWEFRLKVTILSSALKAREAKMITPAETCQILTCLLKGDLTNAAHLLDQMIMSFVVSKKEAIKRKLCQ
jgi:hypothetical protein